MFLYLTCGILLLLKHLVWQKEPDVTFASFGALIICYGLFRGYRAYKAYQTAKDEQNEI